MKTQLHLRPCFLSALALFAALLLAPQTVAALSGLSYTVTDLGTLGGDTDAYGINSSGQIVGTSGGSAFLYSNGSMTNLGHGGQSESGGFSATSINASGQIVGSFSTDNGLGKNLIAAFLYENGAMTIYGGSGETYYEYAAINDSGQIAGDGGYDVLEKYGSPYYANNSNTAFFYSNGQTTNLGTLGGNFSYAHAINASGQIVGECTTRPPDTTDPEPAYTVYTHAFLSSHGGGMTNLGTLGGNYSYAYGINASGQIVGSSTTSGDASTHAFLYNGGMTDLGGSSSAAKGINASGQIVGISNGHAFLYRNHTMTDLNSLALAGGDFATLTSANAINDRGQIVGQGTTTGGATGAFLLTPVTDFVITSQPVSVTAAAGQTAVFSVAAAGGSPLSCQWNLNGVPLSGATDRYLVLSNVQSANAGNYTCTVTDASGALVSYVAALTLSSGTDLGRIVNFSIRDDCGTDVNSLIAGFVLGGPGNDGSAKTVLVRAGGPVLTHYGVSGFLPDPDLALHQLSSSLVISPASVATEQTRSVASGQSTGSVHAASLVADLGIIASNDGWAGDATVTSTAAQVGAFTWPDPTSHDDALVTSLTPGSYTANITGDSGDTGIALAEIYDATTNFTATTPRLINASGRAQVSGGGASLIAGFVIGGSTEKTVLVRGLGPALVNYGVTGVLPDPQLAVHQINPDGSDGGVIASNTGWAGDAALTTIFSQVGASSLYDPASADCALLVSLPPGVYTANVTSASNATGVALVEVYEVP